MLNKFFEKKETEIQRYARETKVLYQSALEHFKNGDREAALKDLDLLDVIIKEYKAKHTKKKYKLL